MKGQSAWAIGEQSLDLARRMYLTWESQERDDEELKIRAIGQLEIAKKYLPKIKSSGEFEKYEIANYESRINELEGWLQH